MHVSALLGQKSWLISCWFKATWQYIYTYMSVTDSWYCWLPNASGATICRKVTTASNHMTYWQFNNSMDFYCHNVKMCTSLLCCSTTTISQSAGTRTLWCFS